ncbi:hypothetical protein XHV734_5031 [Xanthomonas hortorum pv. vitians]|nr:hypothetical protein XHV734_5031 [Xanthomonas hortorum pv. vitians]
MVIDDVDLGDIALHPSEADAPLVVDPDAVLPASLALQRFQPVGRWNTQIVEVRGSVEHAQLAARDRLDVGRQPAGALTQPDLFGFLVDKAPYHVLTIT